MRCLFCKQDSTNSKSIEHIIPESLGNTKLILPKGIVCDKCNNYFARKVENPFLELGFIRSLRFEEAVPNKKGNIPPVDGLITNMGIPVRVYNTLFKNNYITVEYELPETIKIPLHSELIFPAFTDDFIPENTKTISRFITKIALESLAYRLYEHDGGLDYLIDHTALDPIRDYARLGNYDKWPCNIRRIYETDRLWENKNGNQHQKLHESDFLLIPEKGEDINESKDDVISTITFFVVAVFGLEFTINIAGPDEDGLVPYV